MTKTKVRIIPSECKCHEVLFDSVTENTLVKYKRTDVSKSELYHCLWPLLFYMRIFGLFFIRNPETSQATRKMASVKLERACMAYCVINSILQFFPVPLCFVTMYAIKKMNMFFFTQIITAIWTTHSSATVLCCFEMFYNTNKFYTLCSRWQSLIYCSAEKRQVEKSLRKRMIFILPLVAIQNFYNWGGK